MYRNNHEEDTYSPEDGKARDERYEKKQRKKEQEKRERNKVKHIKIRPSDLPPEEDERVDDSKKVDADRELSAITGPPGNGGFLTSLAMGAKGPGAAGGNMFAMSEPMKVAFRLLKAYEDEHLQSYLDGDIDEYDMFHHSFDQNRFPFLHINLNHPSIHDNDDAVNELMGSEEGYESFEPALRDYENQLKALHDHTILSNSPQGSPPQLANSIDALVRDYRKQSGLYDMTQEEVMRTAMLMYMSTLKALKLKNAQPSFDPSMMGDLKSEPIDNAWSTLLKQMDVERQRKVEARREWGPSTGQFATPPGGSLGPKGATNRRAKAQRRGVKRGKLTGMMDAPKAVEMEHRGVAVKQPKSKDTPAYREYMGQQEARRRLGNVRNPTASQRRYGQRSYFAGETGGGRLPGISVSKPRVHAPRMSGKVSMPHLRRPRTPGGGLSGVSRMGLRGGNPGMQAMALSNQQSTPMSFAMSEPMDDAWSTLMKARGLTFSDKAELRALIRQMRRALRRKDTTSKGMGTKDTNGAGEDKPKHRSNSFNNTSRPEGGTEDATNDSRAFGVHPEHRGGPTA